MQRELQGHRDLEAWSVSMQLVRSIYLATKRFPKDELYGLVSQLRRAAVSVPSNVAEGYGRKSPRVFHRFVGNAIGSLLEVETQLEIARDLGYLDSKLASSLLHDTSRVAQLLNGLRTWTERRIEGQV